MESVDIGKWTDAASFPEVPKLDGVDRHAGWNPPTFYRRTMADRSFYLSVKGPWGVYYVSIATKTNTGRTVNREIWICGGGEELHITWLHPYEQGAYSISSWRDAPRNTGALDAAGYIDFDHNFVTNNSPYWVGANWSYDTGGAYPDETAMNFAPGRKYTFTESEAVITKLKLLTATVQNVNLF
jgi:hypothetical protein